MGDFNGRTGEVDESFTTSGKTDNAIPTPSYFSDVPKRKNCDKIVNSHGNKIIEFCQSFDFRILNGRTIGDKIGNFTHLNANNGESTIDYSLCNYPLYESIDNFIVLPLTGLSDHSKITTIFKSSITKCNDNVDKYNWNQIGARFKWNPLNKKAFIDEFLKSVPELDDISQIN